MFQTSVAFASANKQFAFLVRLVSYVYSERAKIEWIKRQYLSNELFLRYVFYISFAKVADLQINHVRVIFWSYIHRKFPKHLAVSWTQIHKGKLTSLKNINISICDWCLRKQKSTRDWCSPSRAIPTHSK